MLAANSNTDERVKAAVNALAGAIERQEERLFLMEERIDREDRLRNAIRQHS